METNEAIEEEGADGNGVLGSPVVLSEGGIELYCSATNTGSVSWDMVYVALDADATVAAA